MDLNNKRKRYVKMDRETRSDKIFALLNEVNSDVEHNIGNLMNDLDTEFVLEESLKNDLDSDDDTLNLLVPEANNRAVENPSIEKTLDKSSSEAEKEGKAKKKANEKKRANEKEKTNEKKARDKAKKKK